MATACEQCRENLALLIEPKNTAGNDGAFARAARGAEGVASPAPPLLDSARRAELEAHLASCPACARELELLRAVIGELQTLPIAAAPAALRSRIRSEITSGPVSEATAAKAARPRWLDSWRSFFRSPSRVAWASGMAMAAFALILLRDAPLRPVDPALYTNTKTAPPTALRPESSNPAEAETGRQPAAKAPAPAPRETPSGNGRAAAPPPADIGSSRRAPEVLNESGPDSAESASAPITAPSSSKRQSKEPGAAMPPRQRPQMKPAATAAAKMAGPRASSPASAQTADAAQTTASAAPVAASTPAASRTAASIAPPAPSTNSLSSERFATIRVLPDSEPGDSITAASVPEAEKGVVHSMLARGGGSAEPEGNDAFAPGQARRVLRGGAASQPAPAPAPATRAITPRGIGRMADSAAADNGPVESGATSSANQAQTEQLMKAPPVVTQNGYAPAAPGAIGSEPTGGASAAANAPAQAARKSTAQPVMPALPKAAELAAGERVSPEAAPDNANALPAGRRGEVGVTVTSSQTEKQAELRVSLPPGLRFAAEGAGRTQVVWRGPVAQGVALPLHFEVIGVRTGLWPVDIRLQKQDGTKLDSFTVKILVNR